MLKNAVYISSDDRSGSTMLDLILANHSKIACLGEVHNLPAYIFNERSYYNPAHKLTCMCGERIANCCFWKGIERNLGIPFNQLTLRHERMFCNPRLRCFNPVMTEILWQFRTRFPRLLRNGIVQCLIGLTVIAKNTYRLYKAAAFFSKKTHIVDSSKWPFRFHYLYRYNPEMTKIILLYRNPLAVVYSKVRRNYASIETAAMEWGENVRRMDLFSKRIPKNHKLKIFYEDICTNPKHTLMKICDFLELPYEPGLEILNKKGIHHIGGSPSKFNIAQTTIQMDERYKSGLTHSQKALIYKIIEKDSASHNCAFPYLNRSIVDEKKD